MKILFTGGSSFTGCWFARELAAAGHQVTTIFQGGPDEYDGVRKQRVDLVAAACQPVYHCSFGGGRFREVVDSDSWDLLCHHAADVTDYKSPDFDVVGAVANNTAGLAEVLGALSDKGCSRLLLTGSVFECDEGEGQPGEDLQAFSPYGLSKALTAQLVRYRAAQAGMRLGKFVIPNPFGPYEEPRFTAYLLRSWRDGKTPGVNTPDYIRDNIHVSLLTKTYRHFAENLGDGPGFERCNPAGYVESQGEFTGRFAAAMESRLGIACPYELAQQTDFSEPLHRVNTQPAVEMAPDWSEDAAWDECAEYYRATYLA